MNDLSLLHCLHLLISQPYTALNSVATYVTSSQQFNVSTALNNVNMANGNIHS